MKCHDKDGNQDLHIGSKVYYQNVPGTVLNVFTGIDIRGAGETVQVKLIDSRTIEVAPAALTRRPTPVYFAITTTCAQGGGWRFCSFANATRAEAEVEGEESINWTPGSGDIYAETKYKNLCVVSFSQLKNFGLQHARPVAGHDGQVETDW
jgi:hypothetical protein